MSLWCWGCPGSRDDEYGATAPAADRLALELFPHRKSPAAFWAFPRIGAIDDGLHGAGRCRRGRRLDHRVPRLDQRAAPETCGWRRRSGIAWNQKRLPTAPAANFFADHRRGDPEMPCAVRASEHVRAGCHERLRKRGGNRQSPQLY
jgi:hypothetical protein